MTTALQPASNCAEFIETYWEKHPVAQTSFGNFSAPTEAEVFKEVVEYVHSQEPAILAHQPGNIRFFFGSEQQANGEIKHLLPKAEDGDFEGYNRRVCETLGHNDYTFIINLFQLASAPMHRWSRKISHEVYQTHGINQGGVGLAIFIGHYIASAFPVHFDHENIFHFPVTGIKRIRTWPPAYMHENPSLQQSRNITGHLEGSKLLEATPGEFLFWPKHSWHVGEPSKEFSVSLALGFTAYQDPLLPIMAKLADAQVGTVDHNGSLAGPDELLTPTINVDFDNIAAHANALPESYQTAWQQMQQMLSEPALFSVWLRYLSSDGLGPIPNKPQLAQDIADDTQLVKTANSCAVIKVIQGPSVMAMNGNVEFIMTPAQDYEAVINLIQNGEQVSISDLSKDHPEDVVRHVISSAVSCGVLAPSGE